MAGLRKSSGVCFEETCGGSSDRWNRHAGLGRRVALSRRSEPVYARVL